MSSSRLESALNAGLFEWPSGRLLALRPEPMHTHLPLETTVVVHGFKPAHDAWQQRGFDTVPEVPEQPFAAAYIALPRAKELARSDIAQAVRVVSENGMIVVDGAKTDGVDSIAKELRPLVGEFDLFSKAHGKLLWFGRPETPSEIFDTWLRWQGSPDGWITAPGVFSATKIDQGSELLLNSLPALSGHGADLGAGWGFLSKGLLTQEQGVTRLDLVEADWAALSCAKQNVPDPRAVFHWADVLAYSSAKLDFVVTNPPFHTSRKSEPELGQGFIQSARRLLKRDGVLALVANRHLPYEGVLSESFQQVDTRVVKSGFKVIHARNPR